MLQCCIKIRDTAVNVDFQFREPCLGGINNIVAQRRDIAILFGREPLQPGLAGVDGKAGASGLGDLLDETRQRLFIIHVVDADTALHRHWNRNRCPHCCNALSYKDRLSHQAGTKPTRLHTITGTADVEINLEVTKPLGNP